MPGPSMKLHINPNDSPRGENDIGKEMVGWSFVRRMPLPWQRDCLRRNSVRFLAILEHECEREI